jgi:enoyl-CoA hydratase/carnithine racemase
MAAQRAPAFLRLLTTDPSSDIVIASPTAKFGLPEATRGIYAGAGGLPRLVHNCGLQMATDLALRGRQIGAQEAKAVNIVTHISSTQESLLDEAIHIAEDITKNSPDAVIVTRLALREAWETASVERATSLVEDKYTKRLMDSENAQIGPRAFAEKTIPAWKASKL